jgi:OFA family oxalate/formate antiporter-like MFS transporter
MRAGLTRSRANIGYRGRVTLSESAAHAALVLLWAILALNVTAGARVDLGRRAAGAGTDPVGPALGAIAVCLISLFNGMGRLFWGAMSDHFGRSRTFMAMFLQQASPSRCCRRWTSSGCCSFRRR